MVINRIGAFIIGATLLLTHQLYAADPTQTQLDRLNREIEATKRDQSALTSKADRLAADLKTLKRDLIAMAADLQDQEAVIIRLDRQLDILQQDAERRNEEIFTRNQQITDAIHLYRLNDQAGIAAIIMQEGDPADIIQGMTLTATILPLIGDRARLLGQDLKSLNNLQNNIQGKIALLDVNREKLQDGRTQLEDLVARNLDQYNTTQRSRQVTDLELRALVNQAQSINELIENLQNNQARQPAIIAPPPKPPPLPSQIISLPQQDQDNDRAPPAQAITQAQPPQLAPAAPPIILAKPQEIRPFPSGTQKLSNPVIGALAGRFGDSQLTGGTLRGIEFAARPQAQVTAPFDGQIVFAGTFRAFGLLVIIEHDGGYHSVLAGMERLNVINQQWVLAGEPIGSLPSRQSQANSQEAIKLYVELRKNGTPINPLPFFDSRKFAAN
ncbi:MAG: murein hydrolase activator EnvC [Alphaproteobacteria bacterium]